MATTTTAHMSLCVAATPVFEPGKLPVTARGGPDFRMLHGSHHDGRPAELRNKGLVVVTPTDAGTYPVVVFLHGFCIENRQYKQLLTHIASHGFIAVAPQLHRMTMSVDNSNDIATARKVTNWLADKDSGLLHILREVLGLHGVEPDLSKLALAGHSRGGHAAFAVALGITGGNAPPADELELRFSALIGVDPVAGPDRTQMPPEVLTYKPRSMDLHGVPVLVIGTGLGPKRVGAPPCAPAGLNHVEFYNECTPPRYHAVLTDYGHMDMTDDGVSNKGCMCSEKENTKEDARRTMGGLVVAFLRSALEGNDHDLKLVLGNRGLAPAKLDQVEHDLD